MAETPEDLRAALADRYMLRHELGRGGMATVYRAQDLRHDREVAIKVLHAEVAAALGRERFLREIEIVKRLNHPHILPLLDSGEAGEYLYYAMPCVEGESLQDRITREGQLPVADVVAITRDVALALAHAHAHGIVHRDVKPGNILLSGRTTVIADFGIARMVGQVADEGRLTTTGITVGTPLYMAPEQAAGARTVDGRADLYSLACVVYEMLAGGPPFTGTTTQAIQARHALDPPPPLHTVRPGVPPAVEQAVLQGLAKVPADRFGTVDEFYAAMSMTAPVQDGWSRLVKLWLPTAGAVATLAAAVIIASDRKDSRPSPTVDATQLAVLYFDDLSPDSSLGHVAAGLTEDLISELGRVRGLRLISPEGVKQFRGTRLPPDSIARALAVETLVAGTVTRAGDELRVAVRLIDGARGAQLHSQVFVRPWRDFFALQDSLTVDVANALRSRLGDEIELRTRRSGTRNVAAWEVVRRGDVLREDARALARDGELPTALRSLAGADSLYALAQQLDGRWSVPVVQRGLVAQTMADLADDPPAGWSPPETLSTRPQYGPEWLLMGLRHAERALTMSPDDPEALALRGTLRFLRWERGYLTDTDSLTAGERDLRAAVTSEPSLARAWFRLSDLLRLTGRFAEADQAARRALAADAYLREARAVIASLFYIALHRERFDEARDWCSTGRHRFPANPDFQECELRVLGWSAQGRAAVTRAWTLIREREDDGPERGTPLWADRRLLVAAILARSHLSDSARAVLADVHFAMRGDTTAAWFAMAEANVHLLLGERDAALQRLRIALARGGKVRSYASASPWFRALHGVPAFDTLVQTLP